MIENFDEVKRQLKELSSIVNAFKSEAVQLRLIDRIFDSVSAESASSPSEKNSAPNKRARKRSARSASTPNATVPATQRGSRGRSPSRLGGKATLTRLYEEGYFKKLHTINDIVQHAETNLATKLKQSDLSGPLARYVRDGKLKRKKNKDNQYEYVEA